MSIKIQISIFLFVCIFDFVKLIGDHFFCLQFFIDPAKVLPLKRFLPQPPGQKGDKKRGGGGGGRGRGGFGGGRGGGGGRGRGGFGGGRGGGGGGGRGGGGRFGGGVGGRGGSNRGRGGFTRR